MKFLNHHIEDGFWNVSEVEVFKNFIKFNIDPKSIGKELKDIIAYEMNSGFYDDDESIYLSIIIPIKQIPDFSDAFLHISEISHMLNGDYATRIIERIDNGERVSDYFGMSVSFNTIEKINLLSTI